MGAYYTPRILADVISKWGIRSPRDRVLEPSFGGCELLSSAQSRLHELGADEAAGLIFGADIEDAAFEALASQYPLAPASHYLRRDFLSLRPRDFGGLFDTIIANPPYVRHHAVSKEQRQTIIAVQRSLLPALPLQANLWAFFVLHACTFLKVGGRAAWILPPAFIHATYAKKILSFLAAHFEKVQVVSVEEQLFRHEGAGERSVLLFLDGWDPEGSKRTIAHFDVARNSSDISEALGTTSPASGVLDIYQSTCSKTLSKSTTLGEACKVRIGLVTGDTKFFLLTRAQAVANDLSPHHLRSIVTNKTVGRGILYSRQEATHSYNAGTSAAIIDTTGGIDNRLSAYIMQMSDRDIASNATFNKRKLWHQPFDGLIGDAFINSMSNISPRIILNKDRMDCTNSLYRLFVRDEHINLDLIALNSVSTFGQFTAEVEGRAYSAGLLKHEPSDVTRLRTFTSDTNGIELGEAALEVDALMKGGQVAQAVQRSDDILVKLGLVDEAEITEMKLEIRKRRSSRMQRSIDSKDRTY